MSPSRRYFLTRDHVVVLVQDQKQNEALLASGSVQQEIFERRRWPFEEIPPWAHFIFSLKFQSDHSITHYCHVEMEVKPLK